MDSVWIGSRLRRLREWSEFHCHKKHFVEYDWQSGFKAALGWRFPTKWDLIAVFTYLKPHGSDEVTASTVTSAFDKVFGALYQSATSQVDLDYLIGDLEMGRRKFIFRNYIMRFILGFRGAWIKQDWKNTFTQLSGASTISRNQWNAKGGGGRAGVSLQWDSPFYIGLLSKLTFSLLIMREELQYRQTSFSLQNINTHFKQNKLVPTIDFELGLIWEKFFTESWGMNLSMSYQITTWWNLNEKLRQGNALSFDEKTAENLYLQGLTAHAGVFF